MSLDTPLSSIIPIRLQSSNIKLASLAHVLDLLLLSTDALAAEQLPNFLIIFTDDQGYQHLGCHGSPDIKIPQIDQMAKEGMRFTSFYAQTVCGPSRTALLTGCYPMRTARHLADDGRIPHPAPALSEVTIPEILMPLGYDVAKACP